ncbi:MAG: DinB family protein [Planctomycetes bacterium]|nr:DinB family protein [Planctomycetota bacterium]
MDPIQAVRERFGWLAYSEAATKKMIELVPDERWSFAPAPGSRTVGELVGHLYGDELSNWKAFQLGGLSEADHRAEAGPAVKSKSEAFALLARAHARRGEVLGRLTSAELERDVKMFYGTFKGAQVAGFVYDEHWHHRGQLTVYLRCMHITPPFLYAG